MSDVYVNLPVDGGGSGGVTSLNTLVGALTLAAGAGVTITPSAGTTLTFAATPVTLTAVGVVPNANGASLSGQALTLQPANASFPGVLLAADWTTFNGKQAAGNYITALTGDVTASGPGSVASTIANLAVTNAKIANSTIDLTAKVTGVLPVANGGTNSSTALNSNRIMTSQAGAIKEAAALTNGQLLIGSTSAAPVAGTITAGSGITITNGAGSISVAQSFDPTAVGFQSWNFDDMTGYQATTSNANGLWVQVSGTGAVCQRSNIASADSKRRGIYTVTPGTTTGNSGWIGDDSFGIQLSATSPTLIFACAIQVVTLPTVGEDFYINVGYSNTWPNYQHGVVLTLDRTLSTTNWMFVTSQASTTTVTNTNIAVVAGQWYNLRVVLNQNTNAQAYIDGVLVATNTTNLPTTAGQIIGSYLITKKVAGSAAQSCLVDYIADGTVISSARGTF